MRPAETVGIVLRLRGFVRKEGKHWVSGCPTLDVFSLGQSAEEAKANLNEAVGLWIDSCLERETLDHALRELGWHRVPAGTPVPPEHDSIAITEATTQEQEVFGEPFPIEVTIPAYQAAFLSGRDDAAR